MSSFGHKLIYCKKEANNQIGGSRALKPTNHQTVPSLATSCYHYILFHVVMYVYIHAHAHRYELSIIDDSASFYRCLSSFSLQAWPIEPPPPPLEKAHQLPHCSAAALAGGSIALSAEPDALLLSAGL